MTRQFSKVLGILMVAMLVLAACDRLGPAPEDLDITPTVAPTTVPTQAEGDTGASVTEPETSNLAEDVPARLDAIRGEIPSALNAGAVNWRLDTARGEETLPRIENGDGFKIYYTEQIGGQSNLTFAVFNTVEDAVAHYEFIKGIRSVLETGKPDETLPQPNLLGSGLYGSVGVFQVDRYFVEVSIEAFSSTTGNPLVPLSRKAVEILDAGIQSYETPDVKPARMDLLTALIPEEISAGATWQREGQVTVSDSIIENGLTAIANYSTEDGGSARITYAIFDTPEDLQVAYDAQIAGSKSDSLRVDLSAGDVNPEFPEPNRYNQGSLNGNAIVLTIGDVYLLDVELFTSSTDDLMTPFTQEAMRILEDGIAAYSE